VAVVHALANERPESLLVLNTQARQGDADIAAVRRTLESVLDLREVRIENPESFAEQLRANLGEARHLIVGGGDGTLSSALAVAIEHECTLGLIPLGTANDFARTLGIPDVPEEAAQIVVDGHTRRIDVARVNGHYFVNAASIGLGTDMHRHLGPETKQRFGRLAYPLAVAKTAWSGRPFSVLLEHDGAIDRHRVVQITVASGKYYGGGMVAHEDAEIDDGEFDVLIIPAGSIWSYARSLVSIKTGKAVEQSPILLRRLSQFTLHTRRRRRVSLDGELRTQTPATFEILPKAVEVYAP
jgi:diacylglycerol kinase (ATP)